MIPSRTACLTFVPNSLLEKSRQRSMSSLKILLTKGSPLSTHGLDFHLRNSVCTLGSTSRPKSLHSLSFSLSESFFQSLSRVSRSDGKDGLCSLSGESGGEFSRPYFRLKCDGDLETVTFGILYERRSQASHLFSSRPIFTSDVSS